MKRLLFNSGHHSGSSSFGLLAGRVALGLCMLLGHGWHKVSAFSEISVKFQEGMGIPPWLTALAVAAEVIGAALIIVGLATRISSATLVATMAVAVFKAQADNPWFTGPGVGAAKEPALLYLIGFTILAFTGAGLFSVDAAIEKPKTDEAEPTT